MRSLSASLVLAFVLLPVSARAADPAAQGRPTPRFYYDMGPAAIDVSHYPKARQEEYAVFRRVCAQCHTLARPINAPIIARRDWSLYIKRMHGRTRVTAGAVITPAEARTVLDFLVYDAQVRKVEGRKTFATLTASLKSRFARTRAEEARAGLARDEKEARQTPMETLTQPRPQPQSR